MTARNRELMNLVVVGMLTAIGFATVYIASQEVPEFSVVSLTYAAFFLAVFLVAHFACRMALPYADPFLLPIGGLLTAIGLTMIYRIEPSQAFRQGVWVVIGVAAFAVTVLFLRDHRTLDTYKYTLGIVAIGLLLLPALPFFGAEVNGARLWVNLRVVSFQPGELAKVLIVVFLAGYLRDNREMLSIGSGRLHLPSAKHLGPLLLFWGGAMAVLVVTNDLGGGLADLLDLPGDALHRHGTLAVRGRGRRALRGGLVRRLPHGPAHPEPGHDLARSLAGRDRQGLPARSIDLRDLGRRDLRPGPRSRRADHARGRRRTSRTSTPTSSSRRSPRSSGSRARPA